MIAEGDVRSSTALYVQQSISQGTVTSHVSDITWYALSLDVKPLVSISLPMDRPLIVGSPLHQVPMELTVQNFTLFENIELEVVMEGYELQLSVPTQETGILTFTPGPSGTTTGTVYVSIVKVSETNPGALTDAAAWISVRVKSATDYPGEGLLLTDLKPIRVAALSEYVSVDSPFSTDDSLLLIGETRDLAITMLRPPGVGPTPPEYSKVVISLVRAGEDGAPLGSHITVTGVTNLVTEPQFIYEPTAAARQKQTVTVNNTFTTGTTEEWSLRVTFTYPSKPGDVWIFPLTKVTVAPVRASLK